MTRKVLIISSEFPPQPGGIGNHAYNLAEALNTRNYGVTVLTELREGYPGEWQSFVDLHPNLALLGVSRNRISVVTYCRRLARAATLLLFQPWHAVIFSGRFSIFLAGIFKPQKGILVVHGSEIRQKGISKVLFERGLSRASCIVCVSGYTQEQLLAEHGDRIAQKVEVVNNGIRNDWNRRKNSRSPTSEQTIKLITVGGIHRRKGQFNVIAALPEILRAFTAVEYHIAGLALEKAHLVAEINRLGLGGQVIFHHGLDDIEIRELLEDCDIFLMLSEHLSNGDFEGFGIAIVEAMALGLPAIGSRNSGISDAIVDHVSGRLVDPRNSEEIISALRDIVEDYARYSRQASAAAENCRWKYRIDQYQQIIESL